MSSYRTRTFYLSDLNLLNAPTTPAKLVRAELNALYAEAVGAEGRHRRGTHTLNLPPHLDDFVDEFCEANNVTPAQLFLTLYFVGDRRYRGSTTEAVLTAALPKVPE